MNDLPHDWLAGGWKLAFGVAYRILRPDTHAAEDVAQRTMLKACASGPDHFESRKHFMNWVALTARRDAIDIWRRRRRRPEVLAADPNAMQPADDPTDCASDLHLPNVLADLMKALSPIERKVLCEYYVLEWTLEHIGQEMACSVSNVHKIRRRAEAKCRRVLEEHEVDPETRLYHLRELLAWLGPDLTPPKTDDED